MTNDTTPNLPNGPSFEGRLFGRFDSLDAGIDRIEERQSKIEERLSKIETQLDDVDQRLQVLEKKSLRRKANLGAGAR